MDLPAWWGRVEAVRHRQGLSVDDVTERLQISRASYYQYRSGQNRPHRQATIARVAEFLGEDPHALLAELAPAPAPDLPLALLSAGAVRDLALTLYQQHLAALAHLLGAAADPAPAAVDLCARLLRDRLPQPPDGVRAAVTVLPVPRGSDGDERAYQHQICITPARLLEDHSIDPREAELLVQRVRTKVSTLLDGTLLAVTREHSQELVPAVLRGRSDVLIHPELLDLRPPPLASASPADRDVLVTGVYYSGAPDVAALLARSRGRGFATFERMARLQMRAGLRGLPNQAQLEAMEKLVAILIGGDRPRTTGPMVWATDEPRALLTGRNRRLLSDFSGTFVVIRIDDPTLDYAAHRLACVDGPDPSADSVRRHRDELARRQEALMDLAHEAHAVIRELRLPRWVRRGEDGGYPDAVHELFDAYAELAGGLDRELAL